MSGQLNSGLSLKDNIASIPTDPTFHDVIIVCSDGVEIGACRAILALQSPFFRAMLYGNMQEAASNKIKLYNIKSTVLYTVLQFIYTEKIDLMAKSVAVEIFCAANYLLLPNLMKLVSEQAHDMKDLELSASLLNEAAVSQPWSESTKELYNSLLKPFYTYSLAIGDLNGLAEDALELLLVRSTEMTKFNTPEYGLLLCVIEWAWSRNATAQSAAERCAIFDAINRMPAEPSTRILLGNSPSRTLLLRMLQHINLNLICPHRLKCLHEAVDVFTGASPKCLALSHYGFRNAMCYEGHPSKLRGISNPRFEWNQSEFSSDLVLSEGCTVVELSPNGTNKLKSVRASTPCIAGFGGVCEWDIIVDSMGFENFLGFVSKSSKGFETNSILREWSIYSGRHDSHSHIYLKGDVSTRNYGPVIRQGDILTFHLNLNRLTCAISINGIYYDTAWINLPENENFYPAVNLYSDAKYRIRPHVRL